MVFFVLYFISTTAQYPRTRVCLSIESPFDTHTVVPFQSPAAQSRGLSPVRLRAPSPQRLDSSLVPPPAASSGTGTGSGLLRQASPARVRMPSVTLAAAAPTSAPAVPGAPGTAAALPRSNSAALSTPTGASAGSNSLVTPQKFTFDGANAGVAVGAGLTSPQQLMQQREMQKSYMQRLQQQQQSKTDTKP